MQSRGTIIGILCLVVPALVPITAAAQSSDARYWPNREISFPVPVDRIQAESKKPEKLRFYVAKNREPFELASEKTLATLDLINPDQDQRGFRYLSNSDGEYSFALQFVYADGETRPRLADLEAQYRVIIDTRPPLVRVAPTGSTEIEWDVEDENLGTNAVQLEVRWLGDAKWTGITPRAFASRDRYNWEGLEANRPLEVRVLAKDKAGQEMVSRVITLPTQGKNIESLPSRGGSNNTGTLSGTTGGNGGSAFSNADEFPPRPSIEYVNTRNLMVQSKLTRVTRSGVKLAYLWVNDGKLGWKQDKDQKVDISPNDPDPTVRIPYTAVRDGLYGFIVIPVNGAGGKQDDPKSGDTAQILVEVDTEKPFIKIKNITVSPGTGAGPRVDIEWDAMDKNLMPEPIVLEYSDSPTKADWKPIAMKIANTGRYIWEVEDKSLWKFHVRARAVDKASNTGEYLYEKEVLIDLDTPRAVIEKVEGKPGPKSQVESEPRSFTASPTTPQPVVPAASTTKPEPVKTPAPKVAPPIVTPAPAKPIPAPEAPSIPTLPSLPTPTPGAIVVPKL